jgi:hypothetical protein
MRFAPRQSSSPDERKRLRLPSVVATLLVVSPTVFGGCSSEAADSSARPAEIGAVRPDVSIWRVNPEPEFQLSDPDLMAFAEVRGATRLPSGEIVTADGRTARLRWYTKRGEHRRTLGGEKTPGGFELSSVGGLWQAEGGEILVWDALEMRLFTLLRNGSLRSLLSFPAEQLDVFPEVVGRFGDGSLLLQASEAHRFIVDFDSRRAPFFLLRYSFGTGRLDTLREEYGREQITWGDVRRAVRQPVPLGHSTSVAAHGDHLWVADSEAGTVRVYDVRGTEVAVSDLSHRMRPLSSQEREEYSAQFLSAARQLGGREAAEHFVGRVPIPHASLPFATLHVDRLGNAWLQHGDPAAGHLWTVLDGRGRRRAEVALPAGLEVLEIGDDYILGKAHAANGRTSVRLHRLRK